MTKIRARDRRAAPFELSVLRRGVVGGEPFLFYIDATTRRGNVLYHRYEGHYGVIAPAEPTAEAQTQGG